MSLEAALRELQKRAEGPRRPRKYKLTPETVTKLKRKHAKAARKRNRRK